MGMSFNLKQREVGTGSNLCRYFEYVILIGNTITIHYSAEEYSVHKLDFISNQTGMLVYIKQV